VAVHAAGVVAVVVAALLPQVHRPLPRVRQSAPATLALARCNHQIASADLI